MELFKIMRVCFISHTAGRYGAELALLELLQGLIKLSVTCLVLVPAKGPLLIELDRLKIEWRVISYPPWISRRGSLPRRIGRTLKALAVSFQIAKIIAKWRCDIVYSNTTVTGAGALAACLVRKPHVWHSHESGYHNHNLKFDLGHRWVAYLMDRLSESIIVNSASVRDDYTRYIRPERMKVIFQSVTVNEEFKCTSPKLAISERLFSCAIIGSLHAWKGQDEAIKALSEIIRRGVNAHLLIIGDGDKRFAAALREQVRDYGLEQRVTFVGYVNEPVRLLRGANVALVCSRWEAFGRVIVEAMLAGTPIIATKNSGGTTELIEEGETGLLYEPGNPIELADKMQYLYENPEFASKLGQAGYTWAVDRFTQKRYAREILDILTQVLSKEKNVGMTTSSL
jgi:glycosyltransferase involved in cell wall biosynthesis